MNFDRQGYQKTIYNTSTLDRWTMQVLIYMATYCAPELTIRRSLCTAAKIGERLQCSAPTILNAVKELKRSKLITQFTSRRIVHYNLPTEKKLSTYLPPEDDTDSRSPKTA